MRTITITLTQSDANFLAQMLHRPHLDMTPPQYQRAVRIGNEIAKKLAKVREEKG